MGDLTLSMHAITLIVISIASGLGLVSLCYTGILYMTAQGDPQALARAKTSGLVALGGIIIAGLAFVIPAIVSSVVVEPVGGRLRESSASVHCDEYLRESLEVRRDAMDYTTMNNLISEVQAVHEDCRESWSPVVNTVDTLGGECFTNTQLNSNDQAVVGAFGNYVVPSGLDDIGNKVRRSSGRDFDNNILVYWHPNDADKRPSDSSMCWLYLARMDVWVEIH